jgi:transposase
VVKQPGPLRAFYERTRGRRGHGKAIVATARKLTVLFWCMLTRGEDYAHQRPALTNNKQRQLELTAGAPPRTKQTAGIWSTNPAILHAERALAKQAEVSYKRMVTGPASRTTIKKSGRERDTRARINPGPRRGHSRAADSKLLTSALRFLSHPRPPTT